jgi:transposase
LYRVSLTEEQRKELQRRAHDPGVKPRTRDRLEMVRLSDAGWSVPCIARHLGLGQARVRHWIKTFRSGGFDALPDQPHRGRHSRLTPAIREAVCQQFDLELRIWSAPQVAEWIAQQFGVRVSVSHLRRFLRRWRLSYKRTGRSVQHKQKADQVAAKEAELAEHEKKGTRA